MIERSPISPHRHDRRRLRALVLGAGLALAWVAAGFAPAAAHGSLIRGSVTVAPDPPRPGQAMVITVDLAKTNGNPVEGAHLVADLKPEAPAPTGGASSGSGAGASSTATSGGSNAPAGTAEPKVQSFPLQEYREPYGTYRTQISAPAAGRYTLTVHDRTQPGEDNVADVPLRIGGNVANGSRGFTFPGDAGGSRSVWTWLLWLVALPLAVGVVVVLLVRRSSRGEAEPDGSEG